MPDTPTCLAFGRIRFVRVPGRRYASVYRVLPYLRNSRLRLVFHHRSKLFDERSFFLSNILFFEKQKFFCSSPTLVVWSGTGKIGTETDKNLLGPSWPPENTVLHFLRTVQGQMRILDILIGKTHINCKIYRKVHLYDTLS